MEAGPICLAVGCAHYLDKRACAQCLETNKDIGCSVCGAKPVSPVYHKSPEPFLPISQDTCSVCNDSGWISPEGICSTCNLLPVTRRFRIQHLCKTHAGMVKAYCFNGHVLNGSYEKGTMYCKQCAVGAPITCDGCSADLRTSAARRSTFCEACHHDIKHGICTNCGKGVEDDSYVDHRGHCQDCVLTRKIENEYER